MTGHVGEAKSIFYRAIELEPDARAAFLAEACGQDDEVRQEVETLLRFHDDSATFLQTPVVKRAVGGTHVNVANRDADLRNRDDHPESDLDFLAPCDKPGCIGLLDHYEIFEAIGRGGMGIVLRGLDTKLNRVVAIKVLAPVLAANATARLRFEREAQAAAAVSHDCVVTIFAVDECGQLPYLVMECVVGKSLQQLVDEVGQLDVRRILRIGMQTASGLAAAHAQGLIHRDIKPANILLENGIERVRITDFGLARAIDDASVTRAGETTGTPQYMSPEQAEGKRVDHRSDLFSLGSVLYTLCTGRPAFRAESSMAVLRRVCEDTPRPIREINPNIPEWLAQIINKLLAKDPQKRYQSTAEVAELLGRHLAELQHPSHVDSPQPTAAPISPVPCEPPATARPKRFGVFFYLGAAVLIGVLAVALGEGLGVTRLRAIVGAARASLSAPSVAKADAPESTLAAEPSTMDDGRRPLLGATDRPVKVFILAGDSNMGGRAHVSLLEYQANQPETKAEFEHLIRDGQWIIRNDVWIRHGAHKGNLTVGFGQEPPNRFGPELEFGNVVGNYFEEQVLLIKTEWGGASLFYDFRPPSSGQPSDAALRGVDGRKTKPQIGMYYRNMLDEVNHTLRLLHDHFPKYRGQGYEIAGFVWFQGWNDMLQPTFSAAYTENLANFIRDVRKDLNAPDLPFVIGQFGVEGASPELNPTTTVLKQGQAAVASLPEFQGTVKLVKTDVFWDAEAEAVFKKGWKEHQDEWRNVGSDLPFHYLGSAKTFCRIGRAFGEAMVELRDARHED